MRDRGLTIEITEDPRDTCPASVRVLWAVFNGAERLDYGRTRTPADADGQARRAVTRLRAALPTPPPLPLPPPPPL